MVLFFASVIQDIAVTDTTPDLFLDSSDEEGDETNVDASIGTDFDASHLESGTVDESNDITSLSSSAVVPARALISEIEVSTTEAASSLE